MISTKLRNLARSLAERADAGTLTFGELALGVRLIRELAVEVAALERAAVRADLGVPAICDGVKVISIFSRLPPLAGGNARGPGPGSAA